MSTFKTIVNSIVSNVETASNFSYPYSRNINSIGELPASARVSYQWSLCSFYSTVSTVIDSVFLLITPIYQQSHADDNSLQFAIPMTNAFGAVGIRLPDTNSTVVKVERPNFLSGTHKFGKV